MSSFRLSAFADEADALLSGQIEALRANGISRIELRGVNGKNVGVLTGQEARHVREQLEGGGIVLWSMGSPFGKYPIDQPVQTHIDDFKRGLELCAILGAVRMRMFSFFMPEGKDLAEYRTKVYDALAQMLELAEAAGVRLCHENEKGIYGDTDARCVELMQHFGGRMSFVFDPANFLQCRVRPNEAFTKLQGWVEYMHVKDALLDGGAVVPSGAGDGEIAWILDKLATREGEITLSIEPHLAVFDGLNALQSEALTHKYTYPSKRAAFDAAADALKALLSAAGYGEDKGGAGIWKR